MIRTGPHGQPRRAAVIAASLIVVVGACSSDATDPDDTPDQPPATDTRTIDPPTFSNLPVTTP